MVCLMGLGSTSGHYVLLCDSRWIPHSLWDPLALTPRPILPPIAPTPRLVTTLIGLIGSHTPQTRTEYTLPSFYDPRGGLTPSPPASGLSPPIFPFCPSPRLRPLFHNHDPSRTTALKPRLPNISRNREFLSEGGIHHLRRSFVLPLTHRSPNGAPSASPSCASWPPSARPRSSPVCPRRSIFLFADSSQFDLIRAVSLCPPFLFFSWLRPNVDLRLLRVFFLVQNVFLNT